MTVKALQADSVTDRAFWVDGIPVTKGSWKVTRTGHLRPDNDRERPWANAVAWTAKSVGIKPVDGPVMISIDCFYPSPKKPKHAFPSRNDVDKVGRSILDALKGIAWNDDQQVVHLRVTKAFQGERGPGAWIRIVEVEP